MKSSADFYRKIYPLSAVSAICALFLVWHLTPRAESALFLPARVEISDYDIRVDKSDAARAAVGKFVAEAGKTSSEVFAAHKRSFRAEAELARAGTVTLKIERGEGLQIAEVIAPDFARGGAFLTAPAVEKRALVLRNYLKQTSGLIGLDDSQIDALETTADYTNPDGKLSFVHLEQKIGGIPVFGGEVKAGFTSRGEMLRVINGLAPDLDYSGLSGDFGDSETAARNAAGSINAEPLFGQTTVEKIYFPIERGVARAAWRVALWTPAEAFYVIVDARDGTLLWRKNLTQNQTQSATYEVYANVSSMTRTGDSPSPLTPGCPAPTGCAQPPATARQSVTLIGNEPPFAFNNNGWIPDGENRTIGNAAEAGIDRDGTQGIDPNGWAFGNPNRSFVYVYNPAPGNPPPGEEPLPTTQTYPPSAFQQGSIANAFYAANRWHDELYRLGFTEAARNFQTDNFGRGGVGNDALSVEVQDSGGSSGANFAAAADGNRGRLQLNLWTAPTPDRDSALDNQIIVHELTHGVSTRLHGNASGLSSNMARGMGEGWSDFYALALLSEPTDDPLGTYTVAGYASHLITTGYEANYYYGIRRFPTAVKASVGPNGLPHNPLTFKYLNGNCDAFIGTTVMALSSAFPRNPVISTSSGAQACDQIHNAGEIWSVALWEVRSQLIERHGATEGNRRVLQYVTDGMKLAPLNPTFLQERDAIVSAALASDPSDVLPVRRGFAIRGMGYYAGIQNPGTGSNNAVVTESFEATGNVFIAPGFAVSDAPGDGDGYPEPGESLILSVPLSNETGAAITNVTAQVNGGPAESYGTINNGQTVTRNIALTVPSNASCGTFILTFSLNSSAGMRTETRTINLGAPIGGPPVTVVNSTPVSIPASGASTPYGTSVNVLGLSGNKKIKLELTGFSHTFPGDVDVLLVGPAGQKFVVLSDALSSFTAQTNVDVVLKDDAPAVIPASGNINLSGDWKPTDHNTPPADAFPPPAPAAPYQQPAPSGTGTFASVFGTSGANLNGTWTLYVVDDVGGDSGSLAGWKLTFEPNDFLCCNCPLPRAKIDYTPGKDALVPVCSCRPPTAKADFDGDGKTDISVFRPSEGNWYLNRSTGGFAVLNWGLSGDQLAPGDFDGDNKTDFAVFRPQADGSQPDFHVLRSSNLTYAAYSWGLPGDLPVIEDYDGDAVSDLAVYRPSNHTFYVYRSGLRDVLTFPGIEQGIPAAGDFDGDGKGDFATYSVDGWYRSLSSAAFATVGFTRWGTAGDKPVPADYDGDGKDDLAVFRPSDRTWYINGSTGVGIFVQFGLADDLPVPGDYDGDNKDDIAVYRGGIWFINRSAAGIAIAQFGLSSDLPIPGPAVP